MRGDAGACIYAVEGISAVQLSFTSSGSAEAAANAAARGNPIEVATGATASIEEKAAGVRVVVVAVDTTLATLAITSRDVSDDAAAVLARLVADRL
jgi:hypothetical protein